MKENKIKRWSCSSCGYQMDAAMCVSDPNAEPLAGDLSICLNCGMLYCWEGKRWRALRQREVAALPEDLRVQLAQMEYYRRQLIVEDLGWNQKP